MTVEPVESPTVFDPGPAFDALPLPALVVGAGGCVLVANAAWMAGAAEEGAPRWRRSTAGASFLDPALGVPGPWVEAMRGILAGGTGGIAVDPGAGTEAPSLVLGGLDLPGEGRGASLVLLPESPAFPNDSLVDPERLSGLSRDELRRELEEHLRVSQRIDSLGRLAGGVAHDFNNLLTVIASHTALLLTAVPEESPLRDDLNEIHRAAGRAATLTRQLLAFSRRQVFELRSLDLNRVVAGTETMLRRIVGEDVELVFLPGADLGSLLGDAAQLEQVLMNLVVNARDAMPGGGELVIRTGNVELDAAFVRRHPGSRSGEHVLLEVRDTGQGMPPDVVDRVFEPFFTTKAVGKGTGLGLAMVYGAVKQSGGYIAVESEEGIGTSLRLYFPRVAGPAGELAPEEAPGGGLRGSETILLVEDQEVVRVVTRRILEELGYRVVEAENAYRAVELARELGDALDLLLTDVVMPRMGGRELARSLDVDHPGLKVLFMSGYTDDTVMRRGGLEAGQGFIQKPFTPVALSQKVREVLDFHTGREMAAG